MGLADRMAVLYQGAIVQIGKPADVYSHPATSFVGGFVGSPPMNFLKLPVDASRHARLGPLALAAPASHHDKIVLGVRAEDLEVAEGGFPFEMRVAEPMGSHTLLTGAFDGQPMRVVVPSDLPTRPGQIFPLQPRMDRIVWMDEAGVAVS
jgi:multiple sugar transport system ATP-binding protein